MRLLKEVKQQEGEDRKNYLLRVAAAYIKAYNPEQTMIWDEAECDGYCLVDDISGAIDAPAGESGPKHEPDKLSYHEAIDRSHVACDHFYTYVQKHPAVEHDAELREAAEKVVDTMQGFYQLVGRKYHEFESNG